MVRVLDVITGHTKTPNPLGTPYDPLHNPTVWSYGGRGLMSEVPLYPLSEVPRDP
jgi:hypothetical protein